LNVEAPDRIFLGFDAPAHPIRSIGRQIWSIDGDPRDTITLSDDGMCLSRRSWHEPAIRRYARLPNHPQPVTEPLEARFESEDLGSHLEVTIDDQRLVACGQRLRAHTAWCVAPDRFASDRVRFNLVRDGRGRVNGLIASTHRAAGLHFKRDVGR
jgi:hypothetical protein